MEIMLYNFVNNLPTIGQIWTTATYNVGSHNASTIIEVLVKRGHSAYMSWDMYMVIDTGTMLALGY